ncbi:MAG TPA: glycerol-3-phosphate acyltransferase [Deinococcales bacterium]|nr:glycerol-3-phosphate acyltransferase [Deinococcales bacterium]
MIVLSLLVAFVVGALPLGGVALRLARREPRVTSVHNLGLEAAWRALGWPVALVSVLLDVLKALLGVGLAAALAPGWAVPAGLLLVLGHLNPVWAAFVPSGRVRTWVGVRARGVVVTLGVLLAWWLVGAAPWWVLVLPPLVGLLVLARGRSVGLGVLAGLAGLALVSAAAPWGVLPRLAGLLLAGAVAWRHKENLGRVLDGTEPRLGRPATVSNLGEGTVVAAFLIHPMTIDDLWKAPRFGWLRGLHERHLLSERAVRFVLRYFRPMKVGELRGIETTTGVKVVCLLLSAPLLPEVIKAQPRLAVLRSVQAARLARELGASTFGLGAFFSTVGRKGQDVQDAVPDICVTNGGAYTAGTIRSAIPEILAYQGRLGRDSRALVAAVVGANGVVAFGMARAVAGVVGKVILVGRDLERLERSRETLRRAFPGTVVEATTDVHRCVEADLVFTATSDPNAVIFARDVKPGAWLFDEGRPADVDAGVLDVPGVRVIPGGVVVPPGRMTGTGDWATGALGFGPGGVPACLAETLLLAVSGEFEHRSLGDVTRSASIAYFVQQAEQLGFRVVDERAAPAPALAYVHGRVSA